MLCPVLIATVSPDQTPVDQPPFGSDVDEDEDEEEAYDLNEVSSDVEVPVDADEAALGDGDEGDDAQ